MNLNPIVPVLNKTTFFNLEEYWLIAVDFYKTTFAIHLKFLDVPQRVVKFLVKNQLWAYGAHSEIKKRYEKVEHFH